MENMNMKAVVSLLGVNEHTLRSWERRYAAVVPSRNAEGRRTYSQGDIERIKLLFSLVHQGHAIKVLAKSTNLELSALLDSRQKLGISRSVEVTSKGNVSEILIELMPPLQKFDLEKLNQILVRARFELGQKEMVLNIVLPVLAEIGHLVSEGKLSVAQEHLFSALLRDHISQIYHSLSPYAGRSLESGFALTTREGDIHEFGILISAVICALHAKRTFYLGPNMPASDLVAAAMQFGIKNLVIGFSHIPTEREIVSASDYLKYLDRKLPKNTAIWIGGPAVSTMKIPTSGRKIIKVGSIGEFDEMLSKWI